MGWKNLPAWLKGGIVGLGIGIVLGVLFTGYVSLFNNSGNIINPFSLDFQNNLLHVMFLITILYSLILLIAGFIIGLIAGWIYGKIKKKK